MRASQGIDNTVSTGRSLFVYPQISFRFLTNELVLLRNVDIFQLINIPFYVTLFNIRGILKSEHKLRGL